MYSLDCKYTVSYRASKQKSTLYITRHPNEKVCLLRQSSFILYINFCIVVCSYLQSK